MKRMILTAALALGVSVLRAMAQDEGGPPPGGFGGFRGAPPLPPIIMVLDANHDGIISSNEIANASAALKTLDKNGDGQLTKDEWLPPHAGGQRPDGPPNSSDDGHRPPLPPIMEVLDANHDGVIDSNEIANASTALKSLDKNGDGQLTKDELFPPPPADFGGSNPPDDAQDSVLNF